MKNCKVSIKGSKAKEPVKLRAKRLAHGNLSLYLDTYKNGRRWYESVALRSLGIALRHDNDYPYRNLWLEVTYGTPPAMHRDTVSIELADIYGRWHGNGLGPSYQMAATVDPAVTLSDSSRISIRHIMRVDTLRGIRQIGISVGPAVVH